MERTLIFARRDHPSGYGSAEGKAHGYSVIAVRCPTVEESLRVVAVLEGVVPFEGIDKEQKRYYEGWLGEWFGGYFDLIGF